MINVAEPDEGHGRHRRLRRRPGSSRENTGRSQASLAAEACVAALRESGLGAADVDGICGSTPSAPHVQAMLGIPEVTWFANPMIPFVNHLAAAVSAVAAACATPCSPTTPHTGCHGTPARREGPVPPHVRRAAHCRSTGLPTTCRARSATPPGPRGTCTSSTCAANTSGYVAVNDRTQRRSQPRSRDARADDDGRLPRRADDPLAAVPARHGRRRRRRRRVRHHDRRAGPRPAAAAGARRCGCTGHDRQERRGPGARPRAARPAGDRAGAAAPRATSGSTTATCTSLTTGSRSSR